MAPRGQRTDTPSGCSIGDRRGSPPRGFPLLLGRWPALSDCRPSLQLATWHTLRTTDLAGLGLVSGLPDRKPRRVARRPVPPGGNPGPDCLDSSTIFSIRPLALVN